MTYEAIKKANEKLSTVDVKGKAYVLVNERVKAFREANPDGFITTEVIAMENGIVTILATVGEYIDGNKRVLATGLAQEKESSSFINKTSYIENCETSAVGRALGFAGFGIDGSMCSAEEVMNAINNQGKPSDDFFAKPKETKKETKQVDIETFKNKYKTMLINCEQPVVDCLEKSTLTEIRKALLDYSKANKDSLFDAQKEQIKKVVADIDANK